MALPRQQVWCDAELKDLAQESLSLLRAAIFDERFAALFELDVYGSIVAMFELNNLGMVAAGNALPPLRANLHVTPP